MSRTLTGSVAAGVSPVITKPGYLMSLDFPNGILRLSSRAAVPWNGFTWHSAGFFVDGLTVDGAASEQNGSVSIFDYDGTMFRLLMSYGVADRAINIWVFYGDTAPGTGPVHLFSGVGDEGTIDPASARVTITLTQQSGHQLYCPRTYITREQGFSVLPADGTIVSWNDEVFILGGERG